MSLSNKLEGVNKEVLKKVITKELATKSLLEFTRLAFENVLEKGKELQPNWHLELISEHLELIAMYISPKFWCFKMGFEFKEYDKNVHQSWKTELRKLGYLKLNINVPPRTTKSVLINQCFAAWLWTWEPSAKVIRVSYNQALATEMNYNTRSIIMSEWYQDLWGDLGITTPEESISLKEDAAGKLLFKNSKGGYQFATSPQGTMTGMGASVIITDDIQSPQDAQRESAREELKKWYASTPTTRFNSPADQIFVNVQQRLHQDDLTGYILSKPNLGFRTISIPAVSQRDTEYTFPLSQKKFLFKKGELLWPDRLTEEFLLSEKEAKGIEYNAQFLQEPIATENSIVHRDDFRTYSHDVLSDFLDGKMPGFAIKQSWDLTYKDSKNSDYVSAVVMITNGKLAYLIDLVNEKMSFGTTQSKMKLFNSMYPRTTTVWVERKANGEAILDSLGKGEDAIPGMRGVNPEGSKLERLMASQPHIMSGKVLVPSYDNKMWQKSKFNTLDELFNQLESFPDGKNDDMVDALSQFCVQEFVKGASRQKFVVV